METLSQFYGIRIQMAWEADIPPHFQASHQGLEVVINIQTLGVIKGAISRRALTMVIEWALTYRFELLEAWKCCQHGKPPPAIPPLD